ncbi:hypothetical protein [Klebsiella pneumoniae]
MLFGASAGGLFTLALILLTLGLVDNLWVLFPVVVLGGGCGLWE